MVRVWILIRDWRKKEMIIKRIKLNGKNVSKGDTESVERVHFYGEKLFKNYRSFKSIFSKRTQKRMDADLCNNSIIDFRENYQNGTIQSEVLNYEDGVNIETGKSFFKLVLGTGVTDNIVKHELWHLCMRPQKEDRIQYNQDRIVTFHGCKRVTQESKEKIDKGEAKNGDVIGYGIALEEGMANITSILATIKEKATIYQNGIFMGYDNRILAIADKYMQTGEIDPNLGIFRGHYEVYEDIVRLLIMVSRNDYMLEHPFSEVLASEEGIDGWIEQPVNKPYSSFIYSSVNANADFEREWNSFYMQSKAKGLNSFSYREINNALDYIKEKIINGGTKALNKTEVQDIFKLISIIGKFYNNKLDILLKEGAISKERKIELTKKYVTSANNVIRNTNRSIQTEPR